MNALKTIKTFQQFEDEIDFSPDASDDRPSKFYQVNQIDRSTSIDNEEKRSLIKAYKNFQKAKSTEKFRAFLKWIESKKDTNLLTFYHYLKDFYFSTSQAADHLYQKSEIFCIALTPDSLILAVGCNDNSIYLWNLVNKTQLFELKGHENKISFLIAANFLYSSSYDTKIKVWDYKSLLYTLEGHKKPILTIALDYDETKLVSGSEDLQIIVWNLSTKTAEKTLIGHTSPIDTVIIVSNTSSLISGSWDLTIRIWDMDLGEERKRLEGHKDLVRSLVATRDGSTLFSGSADKSIRVWNLLEFKQVGMLLGHGDSVRSLSLSPDEKLLASGSSDKTVRIWNLKEMKIHQILDGHRDRIRSVVISFDGQKVISGCWDKIIRIWALKEGRDKHYLKGHYLKINCILAYKEGESAISCGEDGSIMIWDLNRRKKTYAFEGHKGPVKTIELHPNEHVLVSGGTDKQIIKWNLVLMKSNGVIFGHENTIISMKFSNDGKFLVSISLDQTLRVWDFETEELKNVLKSHPGVLSALEIISFCGKPAILTGTRESQIYLYDFSNLNLIKTLNEHAKGITFLKYCNLTNKFASGSEDCTIKIWDITTLRKMYSLEGHTKPVLSCQISKDNTKLYSGGEDKSIRIWNINTGKQIGISANNDTPIYAMDVTGGTNNLLIYTGPEYSIKLRRLSKIKTINVLKAHSKPIKCLDISRDETILVSGAEDKLIIVWDFQKFTQIGVLKGHSHYILALRITENKKRLISSSADNTIRVWSLTSMSLIGILKGTSHKVTCIELFSFDCKLISGAYDNSLRLWDLVKLDKIDVKFFHSGGINALAISEDEKRFFSGGKDNSIIVGDLNKFKEISALKGHTQQINSLLIMNNGQKLVSGSSDRTIKVWSVSQNRLIHSLDTQYEVLSLTVNSSKTKALVGLRDKIIQLWDLHNYKKIGLLEGHAKPINIVRAIPNCRKLASGSDDNCIRIWDMNDSNRISFVEGHSLAINQIMVTPDEKKAISVSKDKRVIVWDLEKGKQLTVFQDHSWAITALAITSDGNIAITATYSVEIKVWKIEKAKLMKEFVSESPIECLILTPDDQKIVIGCCDSYIRILNMSDGSIVKILEQHSGKIKNLCFNKSGEKLISCGADNFIIFWDMKTYETLNVLTGHDNSVNKLLITQDEKTLFSASDDKTVILWNMYTLKPVNTLQDHPAPIRSMVLISNDRKLIVGCCPDEAYTEGHFIFLWDLDSMKKILVLDCLYGCRALTTTPSQKKLLAASEKNIYVWEMHSFKVLNIFKGYSNKITFQKLSKEGFLIISTEDNVIYIWDIHNHKKIAFLEGHSSHVNECLKTDHGRLVSASDDKSIRVWNLNLGEQVAMLQGHTNSVNSLAIAKKGEILISGSTDKSLRIWDFVNMEQLLVISGHYGAITSLKIFNNSFLLSGGRDRLLRVLDLNKPNENKTVAITTGNIENMVLSPDEKILLLIIRSSKLQVWATIDFQWLNETEIRAGNFESVPVFLSQKDSRLIIYFNKIYDCYNGETIFNFQVHHECVSFFFDRDHLSYYYLTPYFELFKMDEFWINNYLYLFLNYDSFVNLPKDENIICDRPQSTFPFFFSFLHLAAIFEKKDHFDMEKMQDVYKLNPVPLSNFFNLDIFLNTPLDILIEKKNTNLIFEYFDLIFQNFDRPETTFFQKARFLNYQFKNGQSILNLMINIIDVCEDDYSLLNRIMDKAFLDIDHKIYSNNLIFEEMSQPMIFETNSLFTIDKYFIEKQLKERSKQKNVDKTSIVKCKVIALPRLNDITNELTAKIFSHLSDGDCMNDIFCNDVLFILVHYIWETQIKIYYQIETGIFFIFFVLFNFNVLFLQRKRDMGDSFDLDLCSIVIDILLIIYSIYCCINELWQMTKCGFFDYFDSVWNYFDIFLIPLLISSSLVDMTMILAKGNSNIFYIRLLIAACMFCFWFRFLSFFRSVKETSSTLRLIFNVITGVKHFVMFMILFMLTITTTFMVLIIQEPETSSLWQTFFDIYKSAVGDYDDIEDYATDYTLINQIVLITSTFLFAIIMLNLLVAILGDKHNEINEAEDKTRLYELTSIIWDTNTSLITKIVRYFKKPKKRGDYLVYLYNEKHEKKVVNQYDFLEKKIDETAKETNKKIEKIEEMVSENMHQIKEYLLEMREKQNFNK